MTSGDRRNNLAVSGLLWVMQNHLRHGEAAADWLTPIPKKSAINNLLTTTGGMTAPGLVRTTMF